MNAGGKIKKAVGVLSTIANPKADDVKDVAGNVMGPKGQARRQ